MGAKILIYDNQSAYFELLKANFSNEYEFILFNSNNPESVDLECDMIFFFVYDEVELLDFVKLYREDIPVAIALSDIATSVNFKIQGNIHYLNLNKFKNEILTDISLLLKR